MKERDKNKTPLSLVISLILAVAITSAVVLSLVIIRGAQRSMTFLSRYTYVKELSLNATDSMTLESEAQSWTAGFLKQFSGSLVPSNVKLDNVSIDSIRVVNRDDGIVRVTFSANKDSADSDYFSEWGPRYIDGRMYCDWTLKLGVETVNDNKDGIYIISIATNSYSPSDTNATSSSTNTGFVQYAINEEGLTVTFDGGMNYVSVPVDVKNLPVYADSGNTLIKGSYQLSDTVTAFLSGGSTINGVQVPVSMIYTTDQGKNWTTSEVDRIFDVSTFYIRMFSEDDGVIGIGYAESDTSGSSRVYNTTDGGASWDSGVSGPQRLPLKGIMYVDSDVAFFCYDYDSSLKSNLFITKDGGKTFSPVEFEAQDMDSDAGSLTWSKVYKEATVPVLDGNGTLTVYLTQGNGGTYHNGRTAAKYTSSDNGSTWKYIEQTDNY